MPFRFARRVLANPVTLFTLAGGLIFSVVLTLNNPPDAYHRNSANRLFLILSVGVIVLAAIAGIIRVWLEGRATRHLTQQAHANAARHWRDTHAH